jgi:hypothetical protein
MEATAPKRIPPLSARLNAEEKAEIERRASAAGMTIGGYIRVCCLDRPPPRISRKPVPNVTELVRILAALGRIGGNINQLAKLANAGAWPEAEALYEARADMLAMRRALLSALGEPDPNPDEPLRVEPDP